MAKITPTFVLIPPVVQEFPQPRADAVEHEGPDWEPGPSANNLSVLSDGILWSRTYLDLFSPEEREEYQRQLESTANSSVRP